MLTVSSFEALPASPGIVSQLAGARRARPYTARVLPSLLVFAASLALLLLAARYFTLSAERVGLALGMSPFAIGVLIVAAGTLAAGARRLDRRDEPRQLGDRDRQRARRQPLEPAAGDGRGRRRGEPAASGSESSTS
jgi:hypothetical protein